MTPRAERTQGGDERDEPARSAPEDAARKAERYALDLLALRPRTVREMTTKLRSKAYPEDVVGDLLGRMQRVGYLDDRKFAEYWIEERMRSRPCGPALLRAELRRKGVPAEVVSEVLAATVPPEAEETAAIRAARRKVRPRASAAGRSAREADPAAGRAAKQRLWEFLRRRGFGARACQAAMTAAFGPMEELLDVTGGPDEDE